jgi:hypothetical protein
MIPSEDDIANFLVVAPDAQKRKALMFLGVRHPAGFASTDYRL